MRAFLSAMLLFVAVALAILALAPIRAAIIATGDIRPSGATSIVHHERGGPVDTVFVQNGQAVEAGDPLIRLRPQVSQSELAQLKLRRAHLDLRVERLRSLLENREPVFKERSSAPPNAMDNELQLFTADRLAFASQVSALEAQKRTRETDAVARRLEADRVADEVAALEERRAMVMRLQELGHATRADILDLNGAIAEAESRRVSAEGQAQSAAYSADELDRERSRFIAQRRSEWSAQLSDLLTEIDELSEQILRQEEQLSRLTVLAPVGGYVQMLGAESEGAVIAPGGVVAEIVPLGRTLIADVRIQPTDIGHVKVDDPAEVRITTFDPELYGEMHGRVTRISPTSFANEKGDRYYQVELTLTAPMPDENPRAIELQPGMTVFASILTEERSMLGYLAKPFRRALSSAFTEP